MKKLISYHIIFCLLAQLVVIPAQAGISYQQKADELLPVDCMLPGVVRKLGNRMTYLTPRRPIKTTGTDCEIRGGEYVLYDRANYQTAMSIWLPLAEEGDARAQNFVGEIYEKGLGIDPDYMQAASWYQRAAKQDYRAAQINLGQLYERGLGVDHSMETALSWYRKSSNIDGKILKFVHYDYSDEKIASMEQALKDNQAASLLQQQRIAHLAKKLDQSYAAQANTQERLRALQNKYDLEIRGLAKQRQELAEQQQTIQTLKADLKAQLIAKQQEQSQAPEREQKLALLRAETQRYAARVGQLETKLAHAKQSAKADKLASLEQEKSRHAQKLAQLEADLSAARKDKGFRFPDIIIKFDKGEIARLQDRLQQSERLLTKLSNLVKTKESTLASQELALKKKDLELAEATAGLQSLEQELEQSRVQLGSELSKNESSQLLANEAPVIEIIEPPLLATRGPEFVVKTRAGIDQRTIIGKVKSASPLLEVLVNDEPVSIDEQGLFQHRVPLTRSITDIQVVAIDTQGLRSDRAFKLQVEQGEQNLYADNSNETAKPRKAINVPKMDFGNYHALVIGNKDYRHLPKLDTTITDVDAIEKILSKRYNFKVTKLVDATRYDILSALNELRATLTEDDNLLIYYAGHGELDKVNSRGHWLPVDAEETSTANWISNIAITDILNAMSVRKVLVVADSCYSGSMTRSTLARLDAGRSESAWKNWLKVVSEKRSRLAFSSGGLAPVLDGGGGQHSIFAKAFLDTLDRNNTVMEGRQLHTEVARAVSYAAGAAQFEQNPQYAPIRFAGHESGDFLFVPAQ